MQTLFETFFHQGLDHIMDINAYDHILFIIALCAIYRLEQWKNVLILVTAFTIGHSLTLALSALEIVVFPKKIIEFLIPVTILLTALYNVLKAKDYNFLDDTFSSKFNINYAFALFFGLIHGMGFSNYFKSLLGKKNNIISELFAFNVGIEAGQILIVGFILVASFIGINLLGIKQRSWNLFISGMAAGISVILMMETKFW